MCDEMVSRGERDEGERPARDTTNIYSIFRKMIAAERILFLSLFHLTLEEKGATTRETKRRQRITAAKAHDAPW